MPFTKFPDQAVLIAVSSILLPSPNKIVPDTRRYVVAIGAIGDRAWREILDTSPHFVHFMETEFGAMESIDVWPFGPGFHIWHGTIEVDLDSAQQLAYWEGHWRPARSDDFSRFGFPAPPQFKPVVASAPTAAAIG